MDWIKNKAYYRFIYICVNVVSAIITVSPALISMLVPENFTWIVFIMIPFTTAQIFLVANPIIKVLESYRNASMKRGLIHEQDIYKLFEKNGTAKLHVGDIDVLPRYNIEIPETKFVVREKPTPIVCELGDNSVSHSEVYITCQHCGKTFGTNILEDSTFLHCPGCGKRIVNYRAPKEWLEGRLSHADNSRL